MPREALEEPHIGPNLCIEIASLDVNRSARHMQRNPLRGIEVDPLQPGVAERLDIAVLLPKFEHQCPIACPPQNSERAEIVELSAVLGFTIGRFVGTTSGIFIEHAIYHGPIPPVSFPLPVVLAGMFPSGVPAAG